jgi:hypothetical protein
MDIVQVLETKGLCTAVYCQLAALEAPLSVSRKYILVEAEKK